MSTGAELIELSNSSPEEKAAFKAFLKEMCGLDLDVIARGIENMVEVTFECHSALLEALTNAMRCPTDDALAFELAMRRAELAVKALAGSNQRIVSTAKTIEQMKGIK